jgi:energy-coupling factor transporter ATP-binding protein EcfA2
MKLRDYQEEAIEKVKASVAAGNRSIMVVCPTGSGKSVIASHWLRDMPPRRLAVAHRDVLIYQMQRHIERATGKPCGVEMGDQHADRDMTLLTRPESISSTVQTQVTGRMLNFDPNDFSSLFYDECHHCVSASAVRVIEHYRQNPDLCVLGVTATPNRHDEMALGQIFEDAPFVWTMLDAQREGWLVPIWEYVARIEAMNLSHLHTRMGDFSSEELDAVMKAEKVIFQTALAVGRLDPKRSLVFCTSLRHAERLADILRERFGKSTGFISGKTVKDERKELLGAFADGDIEIMCNVGVLTEGFDDAGIERIIMARPTKSLPLYQQMCLDIQTDVLTFDGWKNALNFDLENDLVASFDMKTESIMFAAAKSKIFRRLDINESMFGVKSRHLDICVTDQHDMVVRTKYGRHKNITAWGKKKAAELSKDWMQLPAAGYGYAPGCGLREHDLRFIGLVMSDGCINKRTNAISISQKQESFSQVDEIDEIVRECGMKCGRRIVKRTTEWGDKPLVWWTISKGKPRGRDKHLKGWGYLEPFMDKDLSPDLAKMMTSDELGHLLSGLHLGDGDKQANVPWTRQSYHITSARKIMVDRLQALCVCRGWRCNVTELTYNPSPAWKLHIKRGIARSFSCTDDTRSLFGPIDHALPADVWCLETVTGTLVTRRKGKVAIVGNCGRGTRPVPGILEDAPDAAARKTLIEESAKPHLEIVDLVGATGRHQVVSAIDALGGNYDDDLLDRARQIIEESGIEKPVQEALDEAEQQRIDEEERQRLQREKKRRAALAKGITVDGTVVVKRIRGPQDVDAILGTSTQGKREWGWRVGKKPSEKMVGILERNGIDIQQDITFSQASNWIGKIIKRREQGLGTMKQVMALNRFGHADESGKSNEELSFEACSKAMDFCIRNKR